MQQTAAYRQCLSQHGFTPKARPSAGATDSTAAPSNGASADPTRKQAEQACAGLRPKGNHRGHGDGADKEALAKCLTEHGAVVPSASPGTGALHGLSTADPKTVQALKTCRSLLPKHSGKSPTASASPSA
ncbi:hypothetical protein [Streptomyces sp. NPDC048277]|uniref:hypothetical protein n=1 Tax=Streptomyces sp. NPDC048277 TaxID=3155027 RepID=UPI0033C5FC49